MKLSIEFTYLAIEDLQGIYDYYADEVSVVKAEQIVTDSYDKINSLIEFPKRGHFPPELISIEVFNYKEIHCSVYRIFFSIEEKKITIYAILDGRRNIIELLTKRLMR